jgi:tryptophanyl-tRNA synthetase
VARKTVFSGIQPTGNIHIGNYLGALRNWVALQGEYDCIYCVVDLHAITVPQDPAAFPTERRNAAKVLLAMGVDPSRSLLYYQSRVPQHTELSWILSTLTSTGQLSRMTQFKEKADKAGSNLGLYSYPVLMAADILLFHADAVPVGEDQKQHLELTRDLAERFNARFGEEFPVPEPIIPKTGARIMSLQDPTAKMSKSDPDPASRVLILDDSATIRRRIKRAVTDSGSEVRHDWTAKAGISNLMEMYALFTGATIPQIEAEFGTGGYGRFKEAVAEAVVTGLAPFREAYEALDDAEVSRIVEESAAVARERAEVFQQAVRRRVGLAV